MPLIMIGIAAVTDFAAVSAVVGLSPERDTTQPEVRELRAGAKRLVEMT